ncbi:MAG TPA: BCCT family transporter [Nocardioidaceae bacterium]|nr:BCCT family transporter [Nocardioidaceae bacterium]
MAPHPEDERDRETSCHAMLEALSTPEPSTHDQDHSKFGLDKVVFGIAAVIALAFVAWGILDTASLSATSTGVLGWVMTNTGWLFVLTASLFVVFVLWLAASRYGKVPLGHDDERPEFRTISWIAMMFSAGMGIGLMFFGVAEPLFHFAAPPPGTADPETTEAMRTAMATTLFHWTLHPWAIYAVVGIAIAYGTFRRGRSQLISAAFGPLLGKRTEGPLGRFIDILAIFATLFGSATSLGLGALQIGGGIEFAGWMGAVTTPLLVGIIAVLTVCFIASAVSGVARGIQWLSNINMVLAAMLAVFVFVIGPTIFILNLVPTAVGEYVRELPELASRTEAVGGTAMADWLSAWTVFYWAWWISWTPFVGMFIARISRGRTIREFVTGVLLVPSLVSLVWFAIFGGAAINAQQGGANLNENNFDTALFQLLGEYPLAGVTTILVMMLVGIFFVSGADAASIVMGTLSEKGTTEPTRKTVIFWGVATGAVAAVMLMVGGEEALTGMQYITISAALPFVLVMLGLSVSIVKDLRSDPLMLRVERGARLMEQAVIEGVSEHGDGFALVICGEHDHEHDAAPHAGPPAQESLTGEQKVGID